MELLLAVGIRAILMALALPVVSSVRQTSREAATLQQLRQIGVAMHLYSNENRGYFPPGYFYDPEARPRERTWVSELLVYMGLPRNFYSAEQNPFVSPMSRMPIRSGLGATFTPFTYSVHGGICPDISLGDRRVPRAMITRPSEVILVGDGCQLANTYAAATLSRPPEFTSTTSNRSLDEAIPVGPDQDDGSARGWLRYRNRGKVAVLMVDGHSRMIARGEVRYRNLIFNR